jgi:hypothetical protein
MDFMTDTSGVRLGLQLGAGGFDAGEVEGVIEVQFAQPRLERVESFDNRGAE